jgi:phytoene/squalene synthetase
MRYQWWREALGGGRGAGVHESLQALFDSGVGADFAEGLIGIAEARRAHDLEPHPFSDLAALESYAERTAGALMGLAARACSVELNDTLLSVAGRAWGLIGAVRAGDYWTARGRSILPVGATQAEVLARATVLYEEARSLARKAQAAAFPALGYLALAPLYAAATTSNRAPSLFARQTRLIWASASGRL